MVGISWFSAAVLVLVISGMYASASSRHQRLDRRGVLGPRGPPLKVGEPAQSSVKEIKAEIEKQQRLRRTHEANVAASKKANEDAHENFMWSMERPPSGDSNADERATIKLHQEKTKLELELSGHKKALKESEKRLKDLEKQKGALRTSKLKEFVGLGKKTGP